VQVFCRILPNKTIKGKGEAPPEALPKKIETIVLSASLSSLL
jgi:hypothetical protein